MDGFIIWAGPMTEVIQESYAEETANFNAIERVYATGELYGREIEGVNIRWSYEYGEEIHSYHIPLYTEH